MPVSRSRALFGRIVCCVLAMAGSAAAAQESREQPSRRFEQDKAIDVEIRIVPFYAVDADGNPIYDLKREEVEIRVGGVPIPVETFDHYAAPAEEAQPRAAAPAPSTSRHVFFLFDAGFSSPAGFNASQQLASDLVQGWPGADRLYLMVNETQAGIVQKLGPVAADPRGKQKLLAEIRNLKPEVRRVNLGLDNDFGPAAGSIMGGGKDSRPESQMSHNYDTMRGSARGEYHGAARDFADSLEALAANLRRVSGPKLLLVFSQGIDPGLYFDGDTSIGMGSDETIRVTARRAPPLSERFKGPLEALAESGVLALFVNTTQAQVADNPLLHMAKTTGGLYLDGVDRRGMKQRIATSTAAYYEAGFYPTGPLLEAARAGIEVTVRRPGVRAWAPAAVKTREAYRVLSAYEKRLMVIDLISGGPEAQRARGSVRLTAQELSGKVLGRSDGARRQLRFEADWPADLASRRLDLYNVLLTPTRKGKPAQIVQFDQREGIAAEGRGALEASVGLTDAYVWGIVAVDPETEQAWYRRLSVQPGSAKK